MTLEKKFQKSSRKKGFQNERTVVMKLPTLITIYLLAIEFVFIITDKNYKFEEMLMLAIFEGLFIACTVVAITLPLRKLLVHLLDKKEMREHT